MVAHSFGGRVVTWLAAHDRAMFEKIVFTGAAGIRPQPSEKSKKRSAAYQRGKKAIGILRKMKVFGALPDRL